jgi:hypothetical protein
MSKSRIHFILIILIIFIHLLPNTIKAESQIKLKDLSIHFDRSHSEHKWSSPMQCSSGFFNFDFSVKSVDEFSYRILEPNNKEKWWFEEVLKNSEASYKFKGFRSGFNIYKTSREGTADAHVSNLFYYFDFNKEPCKSNIFGKHIVNDEVKTLTEIGDWFEGVTASLDVTLNIYENTTDDSCYKFTLIDGFGSEIELGEGNGIYKASLPLKLIQKKICDSAYLKLPQDKERDFELFIKLLELQ